MQNHDQIGNRAFGERLAKLTSPDALRAVTAVTLLCPHIPMLFMGEEWASQTPFYFFCDFGPDLAPLVKEGRREEFAKFPEFQDEKTRELIPDPTSELTFLHSILNWRERDEQQHKDHHEFVRKLLKTRSREIVPHLKSICGNGKWRQLGTTVVEIRWRLSDAEVVLLANLGDTSANLDLAPNIDGMRLIFSTQNEPINLMALDPWSVTWLKNGK